MRKVQARKLPKILLATNDFPPYFSGGISNFYFNLCKNDSEGLFKTIAPYSKSAKDFDIENDLDVIRVRTPLIGGVVSRFVQLTLFSAIAVIESFRNNVIAIWCGHVYLTPIGYLLKILSLHLTTYFSP